MPCRILLTLSETECNMVWVGTLERERGRNTRRKRRKRKDKEQMKEQEDRERNVEKRRVKIVEKL